MSGCGPTSHRRLRVSCAASLSVAVQEACRVENIEVDLQSGGSNTLARQVSLGAQVDLLLLADDKLARKLLVPKGFELQELVTNRLVLIAPAESQLTLAASPPAEPLDWRKILRQNGKRALAVADPATAPLGNYTREALRSVGGTPETIPLQDASAVLSAVALGHASLGIVYRTDAIAEPRRVKILANIPSEIHGKIGYIAVLPGDPSAAALTLLDSLQTGKGRDILTSRGFLPASNPPKP